MSRRRRFPMEASTRTECTPGPSSADKRPSSSRDSGTCVVPTTTSKGCATRSLIGSGTANVPPTCMSSVSRSESPSTLTAALLTLAQSGRQSGFSSRRCSSVRKSSVSGSWAAASGASMKSASTGAMRASQGGNLGTFGRDNRMKNPRTSSESPAAAALNRRVAGGGSKVSSRGWSASTGPFQTRRATFHDHCGEPGPV